MHPVQSSDDIQSFFDAFANQNFEMHGPAQSLLTYRMHLLKQEGQFKKEHKVLDIGCGNGHHLSEFEGLVSEAIGVDISSKMVDSARELVKKHTHTTFRFIQSDATSLPFDNCTFDRVICVGALEHMLDKKPYYKKPTVY